MTTEPNIPKLILGPSARDDQALNVTHSILVTAAARWLKRKCAVVITELSTVGEVPDAIGWQGTHSTVIECKVSRQDFVADQNKFFRRHSEMGVGQNRYFMAPPGILSLTDLPDPRWGLLELTACGVQVAKKSDHFEGVNDRHEIAILLSVLRRIGSNSPKTVSIRCYTIESKNTATVSILPVEDILTNQESTTP